MALIHGPGCTRESPLAAFLREGGGIAPTPSTAPQPGEAPMPGSPRVFPYPVGSDDASRTARSRRASRVALPPRTPMTTSLKRSQGVADRRFRRPVRRPTCSAGSMVSSMTLVNTADPARLIQDMISGMNPLGVVQQGAEETSRRVSSPKYALAGDAG